MVYSNVCSLTVGSRAWATYRVLTYRKRRSCRPVAHRLAVSAWARLSPPVEPNCRCQSGGGLDS